MSRADDEWVLLERFARLALSGIHREYPNKIAHVLVSDADVAPPRALTPAFYGCFDWHSAVHSHWLLARLLRLHPDAPFAAAAAAALDASLTAEAIAGEVAYLTAPGREAFERPYGLAWLLQLAAELREQTGEPRARDPASTWAATLAPLETAAATALKRWLPKLAYPIRTGTHNQTAFAFGLVLDWARIADDAEMMDLVTAAALRFHADDADGPLAYEPSGEDFLSPCLMQADLMRRLFEPDRFAAWLSRFLPHLPHDPMTGWLTPAEVRDPSDGKLVHLDGLNLSRAWALDGIAAGLPETDPRIPALHAASRRHAEVGLAAVSDAHYAGAHWLGTFAVYLLTRRGLG